MSRPTNPLEAALWYAQRGWPVFPLAPRSKLPLIPASKGGRGLHDATTESSVIRAWWTAHPSANIGLRTGVRFDVVDLDSEAAVDALETVRNGRERIEGPIVATAHGYHYLVQPTGLGNRAGVLPGIDFRGQGGYVVAPPSVHPDGHTYRWINPDWGGLRPAPSWLVDLLSTQRELVRTGSQVVRTSSAYGHGALRRELERLSTAQVGERNHMLNRASYSLGQLVTAGALDEKETIAALTRAGQDLGLGLRECERTVASGLRAGMGRPRSLTIGQ